VLISISRHSPRPTCYECNMCMQLHVPPNYTRTRLQAALLAAVIASRCMRPNCRQLLHLTCVPQNAEQLGGDGRIICVHLALNSFVLSGESCRGSTDEHAVLFEYDTGPPVDATVELACEPNFVMLGGTLMQQIIVPYKFCYMGTGHLLEPQRLGMCCNRTVRCLCTF
jgi:hypothetical protein